MSLELTKVMSKKAGPNTTMYFVVGNTHVVIGVECDDDVEDPWKLLKKEVKRGSHPMHYQDWEDRFDKMVTEYENEKE